MSAELKGYLFSVLYGIICLALAIGLHKLGVSKKYCRKVVHILGGFEWLILYSFHGATIHFLIVCLMFLALLTVIYFKNFLPMISSDGDNAPGTVYYCVAMSIMAFICIFVPNMILPFGIGVFCTSLGDGFVGLIGQSIKKHTYKRCKNDCRHNKCQGVTNLECCWKHFKVDSKVENQHKTKPEVWNRQTQQSDKHSDVVE